MLQTILKEMKSSLGAHKTISALESSEQFFEFVRALFMISLALAFSPVRQDRNVAEYIQQLSIELYLHLCNHNKIQRVTRLSHSSKSVKLMNASLTVLGLPGLDGVLMEETETIISDGSPKLDKQDVKYGQVPKIEKQDKCVDNQNADASKSGGSDRKVSDVQYAANKSVNRRSTSAFDHKPGDGVNHRTENTDEQEGQQKIDLKDEKTFRGWTYNFGHKTREDSSINEGAKIHRTFPLAYDKKPLDPKKQWQTYRHKCVGLPVDPEFFASPAPSCERMKILSAEALSPNESSLPLINLSVPYIKQTLEERTNKTKYTNLVNREKSTVFSTSSVDSSERLPLHPHDLTHQPMKRQCNNDNNKEDMNKDTPEFAPLVDLAKTTMSDLLEANVGESISTTDSIEYINSWTPPKTETLEKKSSIRRKYLGNVLVVFFVIETILYEKLSEIYAWCLELEYRPLL